MGHRMKYGRTSNSVHSASDIARFCASAVLRRSLFVNISSSTRQHTRTTYVNHVHCRQPLCNVAYDLMLPLLDVQLAANSFWDLHPQQRIAGNRIHPNRKNDTRRACLLPSPDGEDIAM